MEGEHSKFEELKESGNDGAKPAITRKDSNKRPKHVKHTQILAHEVTSDPKYANDDVWFTIQEGKYANSSCVNARFICEKFPDLGIVYIKKYCLSTPEQKQHFQPWLEEMERIVSSNVPQNSHSMTNASRKRSQNVACSSISTKEPNVSNKRPKLKAHTENQEIKIIAHEISDDPDYKHDNVWFTIQEGKGTKPGCVNARFICETCPDVGIAYIQKYCLATPAEREEFEPWLEEMKRVASEDTQSESQSAASHSGDDYNNDYEDKEGNDEDRNEAAGEDYDNNDDNNDTHGDGDDADDDAPGKSNSQSINLEQRGQEPLHLKSVAKLSNGYAQDTQRQQNNAAKQTHNDITILSHNLSPEQRHADDPVWFCFRKGKYGRNEWVNGRWIANCFPALGAEYIKRNCLTTEKEIAYFGPWMREMERIAEERAKGGSGETSMQHTSNGISHKDMLLVRKQYHKRLREHIHQMRAQQSP